MALVSSGVWALGRAEALECKECSRACGRNQLGDVLSMVAAGRLPGPLGSILKGLQKGYCQAELRTYRGTTSGACDWDTSSNPHCWSPHPTPKITRNLFLPMSSQYSILTKLNIMPNLKEKCLKAFHCHRGCVEGCIWNWETMNW